MIHGYGMKDVPLPCPPFEWAKHGNMGMASRYVVVRGGPADMNPSL